MSRTDGRSASQTRAIAIVAGVNPYAEGSAEVSFGNTKVLITASLEERIPKWMEDDSRGWITAEYGMLPRSTHTRSSREAAKGKQGGRTLEIQRLIGRSLRQAIALTEIPGVTVQVDCDVLVADGGTRTAAISGAWVALRDALRKAQLRGIVKKELELRQVAAISLGILNGEVITDLCYEEDVSAEVDLNLVMNDSGEIIEIQGTGEENSFTTDQLLQMCTQGRAAIEQIFSIQKKS